MTDYFKYNVNNNTFVMIYDSNIIYIMLQVVLEPQCLLKLKRSILPET